MNGLGDAALSTGSGPGISIWVLSGDLVVSGGNGTQDAVTKLMTAALGRV